MIQRAVISDSRFSFNFLYFGSIHQQTTTIIVSPPLHHPTDIQDPLTSNHHSYRFATAHIQDPLTSNRAHIQDPLASSHAPIRLNGADSHETENSLEMATRSAPPLELGFSFDVLLLNNPDAILFINHLPISNLSVFVLSFHWSSVV